MLELKVSRSLFSLTEARIVEIQADMGRNIDLSQLEFQFGGKSLSQWRKWTSGSNFNGDPFITIIDKPKFIGETGIVKVTLKFDLLFNRESLSERSIRTQYQKFIGNYELAMIDPRSKIKASTTVRLNVYDEFLFYQELKPEIDRIFKQASQKNNRYLKYDSLGKSVQGRDLHFVILAKNKVVVDKYLKVTLPTALENPETLINKLEYGFIGEYQIPIWFNNIHPDEIEGPDAQVELLRKFALEDKITVHTVKNGRKETVTLNVNEVLNDVIFLFMFTNNPDGRVANTRRNTNGFDLNRDNHFQTQPETILVTQAIAKWTPLSFLDMHGYVSTFLIEPTTPPHNPNYEYDLLYNNMIGQARSMGQAGLGNSDFSSYIIPALDYKNGWDDMSVGYTPMYAMLHGSLGHTIEIPALSQDGFHAMVGVGLGAVLFVKENKDQLYKNQLEIFRRGVNGIDDRAVDKYLVNASGKPIGRFRKGNNNFFPDYYVIPIDAKQQENKLEAYKMVQYLLRNGVKVDKLTIKTKVNGIIYPKGTFIVPLKQAKRGIANAMLYKGDDVSDWGAMYDTTVVNFPDLRGFTVFEIRNEDAFNQNVIRIKNTGLPKGKIKTKALYHVLTNTDNDTIKLVNYFLKNGAFVGKALETRGIINKGDFIVKTKDLQTYGENFFFTARYIYTAIPVKTMQLKQPKVAVTGSDQLKFTVQELGFKMVKQADADVIVSDSSSIITSNLPGKTLVGIGLDALKAVKDRGLLPGFNINYTKNGHDGLVKAKIKNHLITSGYQTDEILYTTSGMWITTVPAGAEILASFSNSNDFFVAGWWPGHEKAKGQILALTHTFKKTTFILFANDLASRAHTQNSYRFIANSIFDA
ncbi:X-prolyl-dipeptidyl aminopeptidase [Cytobacillus depressus]|uniref:X-prolyl-dipeptidyl aminopeptidase n=1 Tax=Cytobacillus depressus TaxID=1602942 RepID=A0A6L3V4F2_9BACI|nr:M14 family zinc carboxypeptidase [Cytobacillus depressus]KAB2332287.1 X-prolyl-dipeptidyl aminopeptidase [Cytobacillus depressus]